MSHSPESAPPHLDDGRWPELIESIGPESILVMIEHWTGPRLRAHHAPEDVWQETLLRAWRDRGKHQWNGLKAFRGWVLAIARHRIHDLADQQSAGKAGGGKHTLRFSELEPPSSHESTSQLLPGVSTTPDRVASMRERADIMREALASLPEDVQPFVRGYLFEERTMEALANEHGIPVSTAWHRFRKGSASYARKLEHLTSLGKSADGS